MKTKIEWQEGVHFIANTESGNKIEKFQVTKKMRDLLCFYIMYGGVKDLGLRFRENEPDDNINIISLRKEVSSLLK